MPDALTRWQPWSSRAHGVRRAHALLAVGLAGAVGLGCGVALGRTGYPPLEVLLQGSETVLGQEIAYPAGKPVVTAAIVTMVPGQETGWHAHEAPLFAWMLEGELTVDYGPDGSPDLPGRRRAARGVPDPAQRAEQRGGGGAAAGGVHGGGGGGEHGGGAGVAPVKGGHTRSRRAATRGSGKASGINR